MLIREILPDDKEKYNECVSHISQSFEWGEFKQRTGVELVRLGKFEDSSLIFGFEMTIHKIPFTNFKVGYLPRIDNITPEIYETLIKIGQERNCLFIKIEPNIFASDTQKITAIENLSKDYDFPLLKSEPIIPRNTFILDLTQSEEDLLKNMHEKTRYNIKVSQKHDVNVKTGKNLDDLSIFLNLTRQTAKRQNFAVHEDSYFLTMREVLKDKNMFFQLIAEIKKPEGYVTPNDLSASSIFFKKDTLPLSSIILFKFKDTLYYPYGGSTTEFREKMANHAIHFAAIRLGKSLGCTKYDMWGCLGENPNPKDPWFGFHKFKQGFGGKLVTYASSYDLIFHHKLYSLFKRFNSLRFTLLRIKNLLGL